MCPVIQITIASYTLFAFTGGFVIMLFTYFRIDEYNVAFKDYLKMFVCCILGGIVGSKVLFFITRIPWLISNFSIANVVNNSVFGGFVFYGGLFGVLFTINRYCNKHSLSKKDVYQLIAPAIPLFHIFGRIGCFMSGCCYGKELEQPLNVFNIITFIRIPTQLIEALFELILFIGIYIAQKVNKKYDYMKVYLVAYAGFRIIIECFRGDEIRGEVLGITTSQIISIIVLLYVFFEKILSIGKRV